MTGVHLHNTTRNIMRSTYQKAVIAISLVGGGLFAGLFGGFLLGEEHAQNYLGEAHQLEIEQLEAEHSSMLSAHIQLQADVLEAYGVKIPEASCPTVLTFAMSMMADKESPEDISQMMEKERTATCGDSDNSEFNRK